MSIGFFFMAWIFFDNGNYNETSEIVFSLLCSIFSVFIFLFFYKFSLNYIQKLRLVSQGLISDMVNEVPRHVKDIKVYHEEVLWKSLKKASDEL